MRPKKIVWILLFLSIVTVGGIVIYTIKTLEIKSNDEDTTTENHSSSSNQSQANENNNPQNIGNFGDNSDFLNIQDSHNYVFVGDSRYVAMEPMKGPNDTFICDNGVGRFFLTQNMNQILEAASAPESRIVIGLGVNDITSSDEYIDMLKDLRNKTNAEIFYVLVNPVDDYWCSANGYTISNEQIDKFNTQIINGLKDVDITIIDSNSHLKEIGYACSDGLHYTTDTYINIFQYLKVTLSMYP